MGTVYQPKPKTSPYGAMGSIGGAVAGGVIGGPAGAMKGASFGGQMGGAVGGMTGGAKQINPNVPSDSSAISRRMAAAQPDIASPPTQDPAAYHQELLQAAQRLPELSPDEFKQTAPQLIQMLQASKNQLSNNGGMA